MFIPQTKSTRSSELKNTHQLLQGLMALDSINLLHHCLIVLLLDSCSTPLAPWMFEGRSSPHGSNLQFLNTMECCPQASLPHTSWKLFSVLHGELHCTPFQLADRIGKTGYASTACCLAFSCPMLLFHLYNHCQVLLGTHIHFCYFLTTSSRSQFSSCVLPSGGHAVIFLLNLCHQTVWSFITC